MAVSDIYDHQNRSGEMGLLYNTYFSGNATLTHSLTPTITINPQPPTTDLTYTKLTPHLFLHNLSHSLQPCTPSLIYTHLHIHTPVENTLMVEIFIVKVSCIRFDSINSEITMASGSARKHPQWSKVNHLWGLV